MDSVLIPSTLKARAQWLVWKLEERSGKLSKVPYDAKSGRLGKSNDPTSWCDFDTALKAALNGQGYDGIGFAFAEGDELTGIDIDHPWESPIAVKIREQFQATYCEKSPHGKLRIFCYGKPQRCGKGTDDKSVEVYDHRSPRYLTVTGDWIEGTAREITEQQDALDWLHDEYFKPKEKPQGQRQPQGDVSLSLGDHEVIDKARDARNGAKFATLFYGGWQAAGYPSQSEADAALCSMLAFWTQDEGQIDRIFRQSALMRPKWDKWHHADGRTYGQATIEQALSTVTETYRLGEYREGVPPWIGENIPIEVYTNERSSQGAFGTFGTSSPKAFSDSALPSVGFVGSSPKEFGKFFSEWPDPDPLPESKLPVQQFNPDLLPASLKPWVTDISDRMQCPPDYPAVGAMVTLASVLGRKIGIRPKRKDDWQVVPNLWGIVVGRPGILTDTSPDGGHETLKPFSL